MYRLEKTGREHGFLNDAKSPSFSSTLLDKIYRSIDEGERKSGDKKQARINAKCVRAVDEEEEYATASLRRACLLEKLMDKKIAEKVGTQGRHWTTQTDTKSHHDHYHDQDVMFFSSTSSSSDSSSGLLSSSDTESMYGVRSRVSCFAPSRPKPVRTSGTEKSEKTRAERRIASDEDGLIKSKSRALKIYNNLKKVKQPISPGGKLTSFLNSLFTTANTKKTKTRHSVGAYEDVNAERKAKSGQGSTSSSASRSCLSKTSPSSRDKLRNGVKRTVRFYPVSVIVDEDSRPCGHKCLYEKEDTSLMAVSVPTAWKIGRSQTKKNEEGVIEKSRRVEEAAREFLKEYHRNQKKSDFILRDLPMSTNEEDEDDDAASYSSSDLFELDHLAVMGNNRYCEELPVYETTYLSTNRAIANGLIM